MKSLIAIVFTISTVNFAIAAPEIKCPNLTEEASTIIGSIASLRGQIKQAPECSSMQDKLKNINAIVTNKSWTKVRDVLNGKKDVELSTGEIDQISKLVGTASANIAEVITSLTSIGEKCVDPDQKSSFLAKLSVLTKEVSSIVGNLSGPYGVAINLGGSTLSAVLTGIDSIFSARSYSWIRGKNSFDYSSKSDEILFMNQFCSFTEVQKDVNDYLAMPTKQLELETLEKFLEIKLSDMRAGCKECNTLAEIWNTRKEIESIFSSRESDDQLESLDSIAKCMRLAEMASNPNSEYNSLLLTLNQYNNESMSSYQSARYEAVVKGFANFKTSLPSFEQCLGFGPDAYEESRLGDYDRFVTKVLMPTKVQVFDREQEMLAGRTNEMYRGNLGAETLKDLNVLDWLTPQVQQAEETLEDGNYKLSSAKVAEALRDLEERIIGELVPEYLYYLGGKNLREVNGMVYLELDFKRKAKVLLGLHQIKKSQKPSSRYSRRKLSTMTDQQVLAMIRAESDMDTRTYEAELSRLLKALRSSLQNSYAFGQYCDYIRYTGNGTTGIESICTRYSRQIRDAYKYLITAVPDFADYIDLDNLFPSTNLRLPVNRVEEYNKLLKEWEDKNSELYIKLD